MRCPLAASNGFERTAMWSFRASRSYGPTDERAPSFPGLRFVLPACFVGVVLLTRTTPGGAQPRQAQPQPEKPAPVQPAPATPPAPAVDDMMQAKAGGITADQVAARAAATSYQARAAEETANAAA